MIDKLSKLGTHCIKDNRLRRYVLIVNKVSLFMALFDFVAGLFWLGIGLHYPALIFLTAALAFGLILPLLNWYRCYNASRFLFYLFGVASVACVSLYFGERSYAHFVLFMAASHVFSVMSPREYKLWIPAASIPVFAFSFLWLSDFQFGYRLDPETLADVAPMIHAIMWSFTFIFIMIAGYFYTSLELGYEAKLQELIQSLNAEIKIRQETENRLAKAKEQNDTLVAILCHDIVNSLVAVQYASKELAKEIEPVSLTQRESIDELFTLLNDNLQNITNLVVHVRKMAMMVNGTLQLTLAPICLRAVLQKALRMFDPMFRDKDIRPRLHVAEDLYEALVWGDETTLVNEVFGNVLSNAIKFSNEHAELDISIIEDAGQSLVVEVRDYGVGIPKRVREVLFDLKIKMSCPGTRGETGLGLGLSLVRSHVELLKGRVRCHSLTADEVPGERPGTTISLEFSRCSAQYATGF